MRGKVSREEKKKEWIIAVNGLCDEIARWANAKSWPVARQEKTIREETYGEYVVPELAIATPQGRILINPIALGIIGANGRVDIEAFPSFIRFILVREEDNWVLYTDNHIRWPESWNQETFSRLAVELSAA